MRLNSQPYASAAGGVPGRLCRLCDAQLSSPTLRFEDVPALLGTSQRSDLQGDHFLDFNAYVCPRCALIQTDALFDPAWYECVHSHGVGGTWDDHRRAFAKFVLEETGSNGTVVNSILEPGPSVNPIARELTCIEDVAVTYVDLMPLPPFETSSNEMYVQSVFPGVSVGEQFDLVIASHVLEHAESTSRFFLGLVDHLADGGTIVVSIPDFEQWLDGNYWNFLTSEHVAYPLIAHLHRLAEMSGLSVRFGSFKDHSVFAAFTSGEAGYSEPHDAPESMEHEWGRLGRWADKITSSVREIELAIAMSDAPVLMTGASHLAQYPLLMSEAIRSRAVSVLDNAPDKHGQRLYGTAIQTQPFSHLSEFTDPLVVVPKSPYQEEITTQIRKLNPKATVVGNLT